MLPARALRTNGGDLKLTIGNSNMSEITIMKVVARRLS